MSNQAYRRLYVMPKRKLQSQLAIERMTGRAENPLPLKMDVEPRRELMRTDQDWPSVWPAAATFNASVVPLPIRMGYRRNPEKRAPFKTEGNLELMKIPNFLHLTPLHIQRHCEAIKKFCTKYPEELKNNDDLCEKAFPLTVSYSDYVHQGTSLRDMRARIITISANVKSFNFKNRENDKLLHLLAGKYDHATNRFTIVTDRCPSRKQNLDHAHFLLKALYFESKKVEDWEKLAERVDNLRVEFDGSTVQERVIDLVKNQHIQIEDANLDPNTEPSELKNKLATVPKIQKFAQIWYEYRNTVRFILCIKSF